MYNEKIRNAFVISIFVILCAGIILVLVDGFNRPPKTQSKDITIYTTNGEKMAEYKDATNITTDSCGSYIDFIYDGEHYKYINCLIEVKENSQ